MTKKPVKKIATRGLGRGLSALMSDVSVTTGPDSTVDEVLDPVAKKTDNKGEKNEVKAKAVIKTTPTLEDDPVVIKRGVTFLSIGQLERNPEQPRKYFDKEKLEELAQSIKDKGVLQPILVRPVPANEGHPHKHYQIVAGARRWQAALKAQLDIMPVLIRELSD